MKTKILVAIIIALFHFHAFPQFQAIKTLEASQDCVCASVQPNTNLNPDPLTIGSIIEGNNYYYVSLYNTPQNSDHWLS
ncbi:MAG: hypothetical protein M0Q51_16695 [Bacteroidales bacterium]|nr:hypothetical protein [Bacteroidales bacterium]